MAKGSRPTTMAAREAIKARNKAARENAAAEITEELRAQTTAASAEETSTPVEEEHIPINGGREFSMYGEKFQITDLPKSEQGDGYKYYVRVLDSRSGNWFGTAQDMYNGYDTLRFKSIKEARRYFNDWAFAVYIDRGIGVGKQLYNPNA